MIQDIPDDDLDAEARPGYPVVALEEERRLSTRSASPTPSQELSSHSLSTEGFETAIDHCAVEPRIADGSSEPGEDMAGYMVADPEDFGLVNEAQKDWQIG